MNCASFTAGCRTGPRARLIVSREGAALGGRLREAGFLRAGNHIMIMRDEDAV